MNLNLKQAILDYENRTGEKMTEKRLASLIWPELSENNRKVRLSKLINGKTKRIDIETVKMICKTLKVDCNSLFRIKKNYD